MSRTEYCCADVSSNSDPSEVEVVPTNITKPSRVRKNMRRYAKKRGAKIVDVPDGNSMFVLAPLKGMTQPVLTFIDSGCSDVVFEL